ncbi:MAG: polyprenyl synthetase family protein, partial [Bacteroidales bacterium]|nr:polyprenyl synthetase family protein [Bacteroidales bacterium]
IFHSFTLIHDDIMDHSPLRRGVPTVWKKWSEDTAILSGDVMLIEAYKHIVKVPQECRAAVVDLFSTTAGQVCEGQQYDMEFEALDSVSMSQYENMIALKTAVLIACAAKTGALVAGAPQKECEALYRYGYDLGMAFQIADDYLDAYGDEKVFGKPIGGDVANGKKSWLTLRAMEKSPDPEAFIELFKSRDFAAVKRQYDALGVGGDALAEIVRFSDSAIAALDGLHADTQPLLVFAEKLVGRVK